jgi:SAM-dependent methyltransferase
MKTEAYLEMAEVEDSHWWFVARREIISESIDACNLPHEAAILEVGCGTGGNLQMLAKKGLVDAIEMDPGALKFAKTKADNFANIQMGTCPSSIPFEGKKYDLICLFDVLEHIEDDFGTLQTLKQRLTKDGIILITVPAYQWLWSSHDEDLHHKKRYTINEITNLADSADLTVVTKTHFNTLLFPLAVITRLLNKLLGNKFSTGSSLPAYYINSLFKNIFSIERFVINRAAIPFGVSILIKLQNNCP